MADERLCQTINRIAEELSSDECRRLHYLCGDLATESCAQDVRGILRSLSRRGDVARSFLPELMLRMRRFDILKRVLETDKQEVEVMLRSGCRVVSEYRVLMADLSEEISKEDLRSLVFLLSDTLPRGRLENATSFLDVVVELEKLDKVSSENVDLVEQSLRDIRRSDLARKLQVWRSQWRGQMSRPNITVQNRTALQQSLNQQSGLCSAQPVHDVPRALIWPRPIRPQFARFQAQENLKIAVPETGRQYCQNLGDAYRMQSEPRGSCVIIDCVGADGDMLRQTFHRLHFRVNLHMWPTLEEFLAILKQASQGRSEHHGADAFACCILSRGTASSLLATGKEQGPGLPFDTIWGLFTSEGACVELVGKPKLFFIQSYNVHESPSLPPVAALGQHHRHRDEDLEMDMPVVTYGADTVPSAADIFWSHCRSEAWQLEESGHRSVYAQAVSTALLAGQRRKMNLLDVHTEVNRLIYEHNQRTPGERYSISLRHTLRKNLFL